MTPAERIAEIEATAKYLQLMRFHGQEKTAGDDLLFLLDHIAQLESQIAQYVAMNTRNGPHGTVVCEVCDGSGGSAETIVHFPFCCFPEIAGLGYWDEETLREGVRG